MKKTLLSLLVLAASATCSFGQSSGGFSGRDNLGNHTATKTLNMDGNFISGDTDDEGIFVETNGDTTFTGDLDPDVNNAQDLGDNAARWYQGNFKKLAVGSVTNVADNSVGIGTSGTESIGENSLAVGRNVIVAGDNSTSTGRGNTITTNSTEAFAAGRNATIDHPGVVLLKDSDDSVSSTIEDQFIGAFDNGYSLQGGDLVVEGNILPSVSNATTIGSLSLPFNELYVGTNSVFFGTNILSVIGPDTTNLLYNGNQLVSAAIGDNLGDHVATQIVTMSGFALSGDGDDEGLLVQGNGDVTLSDRLLPDITEFQNIGALTSKFQRGYFEGLVVGGPLDTVADDSVAIGGGATAATGLRSIAQGFSAVASGADSSAFGNNSVSSGAGSFAAARGTATNQDSVAFAGGESYGIQSVGMADGIASGQRAVAIGGNTIAQGQDSFAQGEQSVATMQHSVAFGDRANSVHQRSFVWSSTEAIVSTTESNQFIVNAPAGLKLVMTPLVMNGNFMSGDGDSEGLVIDGLGDAVFTGDVDPSVNVAQDLGNTNKRWDEAFVEHLSVGVTLSPGLRSMSVGNNADASGADSVAIGSFTDVPGDASVGAGTGCNVNGDSSFLFGVNSTITTNGSFSFASGNLITVNHEGVVAFNDRTAVMASTTNDQYIACFDNGYILSGGDIVVDGNILPSVSNAVDLGSAELPFNELYLGTNSVNMGTNILSVVGPDVDGLVFNDDVLSYPVIYPTNSATSYTKTGAGLEIVSNLTFSSVFIGDFEAIALVNMEGDTAEDEWQIAIYDDGVIIPNTERSFVEKDTATMSPKPLYHIINVPAVSVIDIRVLRITGSGDVDITNRGFALKPVHIRTF